MLQRPALAENQVAQKITRTLITHLSRSSRLNDTCHLVKGQGFCSECDDNLTDNTVEGCIRKWKLFRVTFEYTQPERGAMISIFLPRLYANRLASAFNNSLKPSPLAAAYVQHPHTGSKLSEVVVATIERPIIFHVTHRCLGATRSGL